jgi:DNA-binding FadR family transcriptional regulator
MASSGATVRPIESRSVVEQVTAELRRSILTGALAPGQEFSLREIAGLLNVSFIPVREALRSLEADGLVVTRPGRSAAVAPLDLNDLQAIYRLRHELEPNIAARACVLLSDADLDRLDRQATEFGDVKRGIDEIYEAHHNFHQALLAPAATEWRNATSGSGSAASTRTRASTIGASRPTTICSRSTAAVTPRRSPRPCTITSPTTSRSRCGPSTPARGPDPAGSG